MSEEESCEYLEKTTKGYGCKLRNQILPIAEMTSKCSNPDLFDMCIDAYNSLSRGQEAIDDESTDSFLWLMESANQFENLGEIDNTINVVVKAIEFALSKTLAEKAYTFYCYGRAAYEEGVESNDSYVSNPDVERQLVEAGESIIETMKELKEESLVSDFQAELKVSVLGGVSLKEAGKDESKDLVYSHGKSLYTKKAQEYKEGAEKYIKSGISGVAVIFACMGAISDLMLGKPKEGMAYLTKLASDSATHNEFTDNPCFKWTKLVFKAQVEKNIDAIERAQTIFLEIPWSYKDDREFARRAMDSVQLRLSGQSGNVQ
ncbi:MAG: hypothetical protein ACW97A_00725 [Candidatus Thorarchaeota archaeon]